MNLGEPLGYEPDLDLVDDDEHDRVELGQTFAELLDMGRLGLAIARATSSPARRDNAEPGVIDMVEIAPGVYARKPRASQRRRNPLSRIARLEQAFSALRREINR